MTEHEHAEVKCTRCRNQHKQNERPESKKDRHGFRNSICPKCSGTLFTRVIAAKEKA